VNEFSNNCRLQSSLNPLSDESSSNTNAVLISLVSNSHILFELSNILGDSSYNDAKRLLEKN
jgi:hypothetical protein